MPAQETVNPSASVPSYPVVERHRYLWVWPGDATLADPDLVPDMHQMDDDGWAGDGLTIEAECNYQLVLDNLMDLTHEEFVHGASLGQADLSGSDFATRREADGSVTVERWARVGRESTMLEALSAAGADLMYDCPKGECGLCRLAVDSLEGRLDHRDVFFSRRQHEAGGQLCTCVTRAASTDEMAGPAAVSLRLP